MATGTAPRRGLARASCVIWIAGRPGSGKTTLARGVATRLAADDVPVVVLELAAFRHARQPPARGLAGLTEEMTVRELMSGTPCRTRIRAEALDRKLAAARPGRP
jgi:Ni2+-binding GTPase involved in maturation of urease and hydrogenase